MNAEIVALRVKLYNVERDLEDSEADNKRLREFIEGLPDGDEIVRLRGELESAESDGEDMRQVRLQLYAEIERLRAGLQLIANDKNRLMNEVARQTAASILGGKPIGEVAEWPKRDETPAQLAEAQRFRRSTMYWHERAMKAEARLQKIMARCADLLDEDQFNELDAMARAADPTDAAT